MPSLLSGGQSTGASASASVSLMLVENSCDPNPGGVQEWELHSHTLREELLPLSLGKNNSKILLPH